MAADYKTLLGLVREFVALDYGPPSFELMERARAAIAPSEPKVKPDPTAPLVHEQSKWSGFAVTGGRLR